MSTWTPAAIPVSVALLGLWVPSGTVEMLIQDGMGCCGAQQAASAPKSCTDSYGKGKPSPNSSHPMYQVHPASSDIPPERENKKVCTHIFFIDVPCFMHFLGGEISTLILRGKDAKLCLNTLWKPFLCQESTKPSSGESQQQNK